MYLKGLTWLAYKRPMRIQEILELEWKDVDLKAGIIRLEVGSTKNKEGRVIPLDKQLVGIIKNQSLFQDETDLPYVFLNRDQTKRITDIRGAWNSACRKAGIGYGYNMGTKYVERHGAKFSVGPTQSAFPDDQYPPPIFH